MRIITIEFYVALGYKAEVIKDYFLNYKSLNSDFAVELGTGKVGFWVVKMWIGGLI